MEENKKFECIELPKAHTLVDLYKELSENYKICIENSLNTCRIELEKILRNYSNCFVEWRYIYESGEEIKTFSFDFAKQFLDTLYTLSKTKVYKTDEIFGTEKALKISMEGNIINE